MDPEAEAPRQELKRRETEALLVSMRARTIAAEMRMHALGERVHALGAELTAHRQDMRALRGENAALEARLQVRDTDGTRAPAGAERRSVLTWLGALIGTLRRDHD